MYMIGYKIIKINPKLTNSQTQKKHFTKVHISSKQTLQF